MSPDRLLAHLAEHVPGGELEARSLARTRALVAWLSAPLDEHADPTHVTGSAIVVSPDGRVLLHRHKRLARWLQPGGHLDPGETPWEAAVRETVEETGLVAHHPGAGPHLLHVDVHEGPRGHVHLDLRYLLHGDAEVALHPALGESPHVAWWQPEDAARISDASTVAALSAAGLDRRRRRSLTATGVSPTWWSVSTPWTATARRATPTSGPRSDVAGEPDQPQLLQPRWPCQR